MGLDGYLTIQETASKIGMPTSWVTEQICDGKLGATLAGRQWLISSRDVERLCLTIPAYQKPREVVHDFLPEPTKKKQPATRPKGKPPTPARNESGRASKVSPSSSNNGRTETMRAQRPTLTQRIKELDREFDRLSATLRRALQVHKSAGGSDTRANPPDKSIRKWRTMKAELQKLISIAEAKGLDLPRNLSIYEVLNREMKAIQQQTKSAKKTRPKKPIVPVKGIDGYFGGPGRATSSEARKMPADVEAKLIILRQRARAAAHDMRDRGKSPAARDAAAARWAQARSEAERLEQAYGLPRRRE